MSDAGEFVDLALQRESSWEKAMETRGRLGGSLKVYGASVGAVRGTVRDALNRHKNLGHDDITALSSELWVEPVFERRLAAVVLLQTKVGVLLNTDLTRLEGFLRQAGTRELADPLAADVVRPLLAGLEGQARERAERVLDRWAADADPWLRRAALLSRAGQVITSDGDPDGFARR
ncbi:DNA alkylation repair protein [Arthrobacter cavernae]|uniref:DNA alkylation repair protein n=1 Tax=Arthrobacter cavernae TaxID=2817681 RepID=A0A939HIY7_9MICC|nr:DNA alkylation repair protein [Arthrobacter cavernae]MBO1268691.1 DNA alkylation repair protein [Arthrobacter cavernae]